MSRRGPAALACAAVLALSAATAQADVEARAQFGFGGNWIVDAATPLLVGLKNTGIERVRVRVSITQGEHVGRSEQVQYRMVDLAPGVARAETFLVPGPQRWGGQVQVELRVDPAVPLHAGEKFGDRGSLTIDLVGNQGFAQNGVPYPSPVIGVYGDDRGQIASKVRTAENASNKANRPNEDDALTVLSVEPWMVRLAPLGLDGIEALVVTDPDDKFAAAPGEADALLDWVALGGRLVISLGEHAAQFSASPLAAEMPAAWTGSGRTSYGRLLGDLGVKDQPESIAGSWVSLRPSDSAETPEMASSGDPVRVERVFGMGRIVLLPYDLRTVMSAVLLDEDSLRTLIAPAIKLSTRSREDNRWRPVNTTAAITTTLRAGAFEPPPLPLVVLGILLYVVVVGPLDWFVLKRLKKERLTTLTFAGAVISFTLLAYGASMLLFSSGARVNRVVFADLADAGREGRQLIRFHDIAGYYSPTGSDQDVTYAGASAPMDAAVMSVEIPGGNAGGALGSSLPVVVGSVDALHPKTVVQLAFRSQRVLRVQVVGTIGPTIDVARDPAGGIRVTNGLPVDLEQVIVYTAANRAYEVGKVAAGATSDRIPSLGGRPLSGEDEQAAFNSGFWGRSEKPAAADIWKLLERMSVSSSLHPDQPGQDPEDAALGKAGIDRSSAFARGNGLLVAFAKSFPVPLPGSSTDGDTYVVIRKEIPLK